MSMSARILLGALTLPIPHSEAHDGIKEFQQSEVQYVYHTKRRNFKGNCIYSMNVMQRLEGYEKIYAQASSKYKGREHLTQVIIPTLQCLWNDVIFLSPVHPHKLYKEHVECGYTPPSSEFFQIPATHLKDKKVTVYKYTDEFPVGDPRRYDLNAFESFDPESYQELEIPDATKAFYQKTFAESNGQSYPQTWHQIPHIMCQDPIYITYPDIKVIRWEDQILED